MLDSGKLQQNENRAMTTRQTITRQIGAPATLIHDISSDEAEDVREIRRTLFEMCRPFGTIRRWKVESANDGLFRCSVHLAEAGNHSLMVQKLGGRVRGSDVCLEIRLRSRRFG
jgi:hypothetical protein